MSTIPDLTAIESTEQGLDRSDALLRTRLRWLAFVMVLAYGIALIWVLATREDLHQPMVVLLGLRVTVAMVILGLLFGELSTSRSHVRLFELALFGGLTVCLTLSQYLIGRDELRAGQLSGFLVLEKDGLIELLLLMIAHALLIPNTPRRGALFVLTMALAPFLALTVLWVSEPAAAPVLAELGTVEHLGQNALVVLSGAGLAMCAAHLRTRSLPAHP
ncbi:MAG TPA: hypothetical protein VFF52_30030 [Isosphaeraceae bacterium]|nr:hypothetical protein [Isosphaeraceae bacterium]